MVNVCWIELSTSKVCLSLTLKNCSVPGVHNRGLLSVHSYLETSIMSIELKQKAHDLSHVPTYEVVLCLQGIKKNWTMFY